MLVFISVMDTISKTAGIVTKRFKVGVRWLEPVIVRNLLYAADFMLVPHMKEEVQCAREEWNKTLSKYEML